MCMGVPMQVLEMRGTFALCEADGKQELIDMMLVGNQPKGTWILNFLGAAREVMTDEYADQVRQAMTAIGDIMNEEALSPTMTIDHLFADLIDREPQLPDHLKAQVVTSSKPVQES